MYMEKLMYYMFKYNTNKHYVKQTDINHNTVQFIQLHRLLIKQYRE